MKNEKMSLFKNIFFYEIPQVIVTIKGGDYYIGFVIDEDEITIRYFMYNISSKEALDDFLIGKIGARQIYQNASKFLISTYSFVDDEYSCEEIIKNKINTEWLPSPDFCLPRSEEKYDEKLSSFKLEYIIDKDIMNHNENKINELLYRYATANNIRRARAILAVYEDHELIFKYLGLNKPVVGGYGHKIDFLTIKKDVPVSSGYFHPKKCMNDLKRNSASSKETVHHPAFHASF